MNQPNSDHEEERNHDMLHIYAQLVQQQDDQQKKPRRRRRKKNKEGEMGAKKRKLSEQQVDMLEKSFGNEHKLETERKDQLALELSLDPRQVAVWFQNRRARWKTKKLEEEYNKLKTSHDNIALEKCQLVNEVMKLKDKLSEAEKEIQRMGERGDQEASRSRSPSSSLTTDPPFYDEFGAVMNEYENVFYVPEINYVNGFEWMINLPYM